MRISPASWFLGGNVDLSQIFKDGQEVARQLKSGGDGGVCSRQGEHQMLPYCKMQFTCLSSAMHALHMCSLQDSSHTTEAAVILHVHATQI